ncbi:MAG: thioredoxin [Bacteroidales bacterium]
MKRLTLLLLVLIPFMLQACQGTGASEKEEKNESFSSHGDENKAVINLTAEQFREKIVDYKNSETWEYQGNKPCLIDFYADWCGPCKVTSPIIEEIAKEYKEKIHVYKVDVDEEKELAGVMGIQSIPTFLYCPEEGKPRMSSGIGQSEKETKQIFRENIEQFLLKN